MPDAQQPMVIANCTHRCNLECHHCYCRAGPTNLVDLSLADVETALSDLLQMGIDSPPFFDLTGGEFIMLPWAVTISKLIRVVFPETCIILETNGTALLHGTAAYDAVEFDRLHVSVDQIHGTLDADGTSVVLQRAMSYASQRGFALVVNHVTSVNGSELPHALRLADQDCVRINRLEYDTLARLGRGALLAHTCPGTRVEDAPTFFKCELGDAVHLDADRTWYLCHYPSAGTRIGCTGDPSLPVRYHRIVSAEAYRRLLEGGLPALYLELLGRLPISEQRILRDRRFHNRCEPCLLLQQLGLLRFTDSQPCLKAETY